MESSSSSHQFGGHGGGSTYHTAASGSDNIDGGRGDNNASSPLMAFQGAPPTQGIMRQQQQQQQQQQPPVASSGLQFQQYMAQAQSSAEMSNAAQLLAAARMRGSFMGTEDPSSFSMLRYQSSRPDLSPAAMKQSTSLKQGEQSASSAQQNTMAPSATFTQSNQPPFIFDGYAGWVCRHCSHLDHYYRGHNYVWMGGQQAPPNHFVEAHLRVCPAINQPWQFGAGTAANNMAAAPLQMQQNVMQQGGGQQIPLQQAAQHFSPDDRSQQSQVQDYSRKRKHEAADLPPGERSGFSQLSQQAPRMNDPHSAGMWQQQHQRYLPQMLPQWQQGGMMGMSGMGGMNPAGGGGVPYYPPPPDPSGRSPMAMQGSMGDSMPPPPPKQPGVVHTGSYYNPQHSAMHHYSPNKKRITLKKLQATPSPKGIQSSDEAYAKAVSFLRKRADETPPLPTAPTDIKLVEKGDSNLLTDYFYYIIEQLAVCRLTEKDRKTRGGKRQDVAFGYGGLQCIHCATAPSARKFFWSNVDRLANSFAGIPDHVLTCKMCPEEVTEALLVLKGRHNAQMSLLPRGSQKQFFRQMWKRIHAGDSERATVASDSSSLKRSTTISAITNTSFKSNTAAETLKNAVSESSGGEKLERVTLAVAQDKHWLSDIDCFIRKQVEVFCANSTDVSNAVEYVPVTTGQVGLRCIHCAKSQEGAQGNAVLYPHSVSGIYESVQELQRLHLHDCPHLPTKLKSEISDTKESSEQREQREQREQSSALRKYYVQAAGALGLFDSDEGGVRSGGRVIPMVEI
eukprot:scaffold5819_cov148-Skeletonema_menzelii.AAC.10